MESEKRESILEAARRAFASLGFKKTSIADVAEAAGVAKGTVYLACESKEDLFYQVILRDVREWMGRIMALVDPAESVDTTLRHLALASLEFFDKHPLVRDLFIGIYDGRHPRWAARFDELRGLARANLAHLIRRGIAQGLFREDLDPEVTAEILQLFQHAALSLQSRKGSLDPEELRQKAELGMDLVLRGLYR